MAKKEKDLDDILKELDGSDDDWSYFEDDEYDRISMKRLACPECGSKRWVRAVLDKKKRITRCSDCPNWKDTQ